MNHDIKRLYRAEGGAATICGVCGGIAEYFGIDPVMVRVAAVVLTLCSGIGLLAYIAMAIIVPKKSDVYPDA